METSVDSEALMRPTISWDPYLQPSAIAAFSSFLVFLVLTVPKFRVIIKFLGFEKEFDALDLTKQLDFQTRWGSMWHALIVIFGALYTIFFEEGITQVSHPSPVWSMFLAVSFAHAIFDTLYIMYHWETIYPPKRRVEGIVFVIHHLVLLICHGVAMAAQVGLYVSATSYLFECTTPFLNMRFFLLYTGKGSSVLYKIVIVLFDLAWLVFRVFHSAYLVHVVMFTPFGTDLMALSPLYYYTALGTSYIMLVMNYWWTKNIAVVTWNTFTGAYKKKPKKQQ